MLFVAFCLFKTLHNLHYEQIGKEVRCIEDELPFEIPENWEWEQLGNIFQHNTGKALNNSNRVGELKEYITTSNLYWNMFEVSNLKKMYFKEEEINKYTVTKGDLLVCEGGDIGRAAIWNFDYNVCIQNHIHRLRAYSHICVPFFYYLIFFYKNTGLIGGKGIGIQGLSSNALHQLLFPIPPFEEQYRIVNKLKQLEPLIDKYKQTEEKLFELNSNIKEQLKKSILQYAIEGKLVPQDPNDEPASVLLERIRKEKEKLIAEGKIKKDKNESIIYRRDNSYYEKLGKQDNEITDEITINIPNGWSISRLKDLVEISTGKKDANYGSETGKYDFFTCANMPIKTDDYSYSGEYLIMPGNGANIGNVIYYNGKFEAYQRTYLLKNIYSINLKWMKYHLESNWKEYNSDKMYGSAIPYIKLSNLENYLVYIPPLAEQNKIIEFLNTTNAVLEKL